nr:mucin-5AC-like [Onthophagus taurus]
MPLKMEKKTLSASCGDFRLLASVVDTHIIDKNGTLRPVPPSRQPSPLKAATKSARKVRPAIPVKAATNATPVLGKTASPVAAAAKSSGRTASLVKAATKKPVIGRTASPAEAAVKAGIPGRTASLEDATTSAAGRTASPEQVATKCTRKVSTAIPEKVTTETTPVFGSTASPVEAKAIAPSGRTASLEDATTSAAGRTASLGEAATTSTTRSFAEPLASIPAGKMDVDVAVGPSNGKRKASSDLEDEYSEAVRPRLEHVSTNVQRCTSLREVRWVPKTPEGGGNEGAGGSPKGQSDRSPEGPIQAQKGNKKAPVVAAKPVKAVSSQAKKPKGNANVAPKANAPATKVVRKEVAAPKAKLNKPKRKATDDPPKLSRSQRRRHNRRLRKSGSIAVEPPTDPLVSILATMSEVIQIDKSDRDARVKLCVQIMSEMMKLL